MKKGESLREELERRLASNKHFALKEAVAALVPLISSLDEMHKGGSKLFVHPSAVRFRRDGCSIDIEIAQKAPLLPKDRACMAPEERQGKPGDASASVFACGAMLYEMLTGDSVGPAMRPPSEIVPGLPKGIEMVISKALVSDRGHRPGDLAALAQALHHLAPSASVPPPAADEGGLDHGSEPDFDVDVSISLMPPPMVQAARATVEKHIAKAKAEAKAEARAAQEPTAAKAAPAPPVPAAPKPAAVAAVPAAPAPAPAATPSPASSGSAPASGGYAAPVSAGAVSAERRLAELKRRLEADPRPRYTVIKDGMDHGPFTAVELLHQIAGGQFSADHRLCDTLSRDERPIADWPEFAPFAQQARLSQEVQSERQELEASVSRETQTTRVKAFVIGTVAFLGLAAVAGLMLRKHNQRVEEERARGDKVSRVEFAGGLRRGTVKSQGLGKWAGGGSSKGDSAGDEPASAGSHPQAPVGGSCEQARAAYVEDYGKQGVPPDLTEGAYGAVLNTGSYLNSCGVPPTSSVSICAAVQNGRAVGVTVALNPPNGPIAACVRGQVFGLSFPAHPRLDVTNTFFAAQ